jgi:bifunctional N-acetylglucosamine-1-phosphate-uridyltransferase/glucosamine-1-phosphate-acetyltransferase GlmU-like protein
MSVSCGIDLFFPAIPEGLRGLFSEGLAVWTALDRLKGFMRETMKPNLETGFTPGVPLPAHLALVGQDLMTGGFEVVCNDATKGRPEVWIDGEMVSHSSLICAGAVLMDREIQVGKGVVIEPGALVKGPAIFGDDTEVRHGAYLRGYCLIGEKCVVGHATEVKHSIFLDRAKAGHFAYVGDSILGRNVNLGAGTKLANLRFASGNVCVRIGDAFVDTGRRKIGAVLGDGVQTGCNSVTNPGALVGLSSLVAPNTTVRPGFYPPRSVIR